MGEGLGYARMRLIEKIVIDNWKVRPYEKNYNYNEVLYIIQEMMEEDGKNYLEPKNVLRGYQVFRSFVELLIYRNLANYDSMILITAEKGCLTDDTKIYTKKNPNGIKLKKLIDKGPFEILSYNINKCKNEYKFCDGVEFAKYDDVYELKTTNGKKIKATKDHPFLLSDNKTWCQLKDLIGKTLCDNNLYCCIRGCSLNFSNIRVKNIKYLGKQNVYDVVNVRDNHNFIANGFIVSNTGKSSAAMMIARYWCKLLGKLFDPAKYIAYNNSDLSHKIDTLQKFDPVVCDESIRFASSADWARKENKDLKKKLGQVRTKHLLYILCFPLKVNKIESSYLQSYVNYWIDLFDRGLGAIYIKNRNPMSDAWSLKHFEKIGSYTEFTKVQKVKELLQKHPNFWQIIKFPKPPAWLYTKYLSVREKNVYDDDNVMSSVTKEDVYRALLVLALKDIMTSDVTLTMNRIILHIKNQYDINMNKGMVQMILEDSRQLITKIRQDIIEGKYNDV
jgi:hypothetical protein